MPVNTTEHLHGLYVITDTPMLRGRLLDSVDQALQGGVKLVQYRDKTDDKSRRQQEASALLALCDTYQALLLINDDIQLAADIGADAVHIGQTDGKVADARRLLGPDAVIGVTCHDSLALAQQAEQEGADYVAFGAFYPSATKPNAIPAPLSLIAEAKATIQLPVVAIGGIHLDNAGPLIDAGADMVAVVSDVFTADNITQRAQQYAARFAP